VVQLGAARQPALTFLAAGVAQHHVVRAARAGRFFFRVTSATIPDALSECRHGRSFPGGWQLGARWVASDMPAVVMRRDADFTGTAATRMEVYFSFRS
jgi:hypothetical protein